MELQAVPKAQAGREGNNTTRPLSCSQRLITQRDFRRSFDFDACVIPLPALLPFPTLVRKDFFKIVEGHTGL